MSTLIIDHTPIHSRKAFYKHPPTACQSSNVLSPPPPLAGFMPERSTTDQISSLRVLTEKSHEVSPRTHSVHHLCRFQGCFWQCSHKRKMNGLPEKGPGSPGTDLTFWRSSTGSEQTTEFGMDIRKPSFYRLPHECDHVRWIHLDNHRLSDLEFADNII